MARRICPKCGHVEGEYTYFCTECGSKTVEDDGSTIASSPVATNEVPVIKQPQSSSEYAEIEPTETNTPIYENQTKTADDQPISHVNQVEHNNGETVTNSNASSTQKVQNNKKLNPLIIGLCGVTGILAIVIVIIATRKQPSRSTEMVADRNESQEESYIESDNEEQEVSEYQIGDEYEDTDELFTEGGFEEDFNESESIEEVDVEKQVLEIREEYNNIVENINNGNYLKKVSTDGIILYMDGTVVKAVTVPDSITGHYDEYFYFNNDESLMFAYYEANDAHRFYFLSEALIRWRYSERATNAQDAVNHDMEKGNSEYTNWDNSVRQDGHYYLNHGIESADGGDYILPGSDSRYLDVSELYDLDANQCRLARNELYARHGRKFDDEGLRAYFESKDWYSGTIDPDDFKEDMLNDYEFYNRDLIVQYEKDQGYR